MRQNGTRLAATRRHELSSRGVRFAGLACLGLGALGLAASPVINHAHAAGALDLSSRSIALAPQPLPGDSGGPLLTPISPRVATGPAGAAGPPAPQPAAPDPDDPALDGILSHEWACALYQNTRPRLTHGGTASQFIALTFDDGPKPYGTPVILSALEQHRDKATFFLVGKQAARFPAIVARIAADGDEIGNHTFDHYRLPTLPLQKVPGELERNRAIIRRITGQTMYLFRPPGGRTNPQIQTIADSLGYTTVFWRVDSGELAPDMTPDRVFERVTSNVRNGDIILLHNGDKNIVAALPRILDNLSSRGFSCVTVSELMQLMGGQTTPDPIDSGASDTE